MKARRYEVSCGIVMGESVRDDNSGKGYLLSHAARRLWQIMLEVVGAGNFTLSDIERMRQDLKAMNVQSIAQSGAHHWFEIRRIQ